MKVAILYSGGKDSTMVLHHALKEGWDVKALIAVKPKDTSAYLYHYATVELTKLSSQAFNIPVIYLETEKIGPEEEAKVLEKVLQEIEVEAVLLGGIGLQQTQIRSVENIAKKHNVKVLVPHKDLNHYELIKQFLKAGFDIRITQVAAEGLGPEWLGRKLDFQSLEELKKLSDKYGFHIGGEGGSYDSFVCDGPIFNKRIEFGDTEKVWDNKTSSGYLQVTDAILLSK